MKCEKSCGAVVFTKENNEYKFLICSSFKAFMDFQKGIWKQMKQKNKPPYEKYLKKSV
jgi:hypothetical protein